MGAKKVLLLATYGMVIVEYGGFPAHSIDCLYFMTSEKPNCVVNIADYFTLKEKAMSMLTSQLAFSAKVLGKKSNSGSNENAA